MFDMFNVTDPFAYGSWLENDKIEKDYQLICKFVDKYKGKKIYARNVDQFLEMYDIDYYTLPRYAKDKINELDVY